MAMGRTINLHLPDRAASSVDPAGGGLPTFPRPAGVDARAHALALIERKRAIEDELATYSDVLRSQGADFDTQLLTFDGYPRADIDVAAIRTARSRIVRLRNDLHALNAALAKQLEESLPSVSSPSSPARAVPASPADMAVDAAAASSPAAMTPPAFAVVNSVAAGSPAELAGLQKNDRIVRFGHVNGALADCLPAVAALVGRSEGVRRRASTYVAFEALTSHRPACRCWSTATARRACSR